MHAWKMKVEKSSHTQTSKLHPLSLQRKEKEKTQKKHPTTMRSPSVSQKYILSDTR